MASAWGGHCPDLPPVAAGCRRRNPLHKRLRAKRLRRRDFLPQILIPTASSTHRSNTERDACARERERMVEDCSLHPGAIAATTSGPVKAGVVDARMTNSNAMKERQKTFC